MQRVLPSLVSCISSPNKALCHLPIYVVVAFLLLVVGCFRLQAQNNAPLTAFPTFSGGSVEAIVVQGSTVYVGGSFTQVINSQINGGNTIAQPNLVAIDANTGAVVPNFNLRPNGTVSALISDGSRIFVGGWFTSVDNGSANARPSLFSFTAAGNILDAWTPTTSTNGPFQTLALLGTDIYVGGGFTNVNGSGRNNSCAFNTSTGVLTGYNPNVAAPVGAIAANAGIVYLGGGFGQINGDPSRVHFGSVDLGGGINGWGFGGLYPLGNCCMNELLTSGSYLLLGGGWNGVIPRRLAARDLGTGNLDAAWNPNITDGAVDAIAVDGATVYASGSFTTVNGGTTRNGLAAFPFPNNALTGVATAFNPNITGGFVLALAAGGGRVYAGGTFTTVGGQPRQGFAAFSSAPAITLGAAPASAYPMQVVTITGTNLDQPIGQVLFNGVPAPSVRLVNATTIEAVVPFGATTGPITVNTGASSANTIGSFTPNTIPQVATFVGRGPILAPNNSAGQLTNLNQPLGITFNATGDLFIAETAGGHRIRRVTSGGVATVFAGSGTAGNVNGLGTAAQFADPVDVAFDGANNLYVSDYSNNAIRRIDPSGNVTTLATGVNTPTGIIFDGTDLVVVGQGNHVIYKVTLAGVVTVFAGTSGMAGNTDGMGAAARFSSPMNIAKDASNNLYVTERGNHRIRKITPAGVVTTLAGSTQGFNDGLGAVAQFNSPTGIAVDASGVVYVGDGFDVASNHRVRMIQPNGLVTTLAGTGAAGTTDGAYNIAQFPFALSGVAVKGDTLFVSGRQNNDVRRIHIAKYQYVSGDAGVASSWRLLPGLVTPAPNFTGPGFQFIVASGTATATTGFTLGANCVMTVKNGATLRLNGNSTNSGAIIVENGGTLEVSNGVTLTNSGQLIIDNGLAGGRLLLTGTGAVASTTPIYGDANVPNNATLESGGAAAKTLAVSEIPSPMQGRLVLSNTAGTTPPNTQIIGVTGRVDILSGGRLIIPNGANLQHNNGTASSFTINGGGTLEIQDAGQISAAASTLNYVAGSTLQYSGTMAKTTTSAEFPVVIGGQLLITNTNVVTLNTSKTLGASATLTLNGGRLFTNGNILTVANTAVGAVSATTGYVDGPLERDMPALLAAPAQTYSFPVGAGATKYPFAVTQPTTGATGPRLRVQAFAGNAMGTAGTNISLLSTTEYWQLQQINGNYTSGRIYVEKAGLLATQAIGGNPAMANGTYNGNLSTLSTGLTTVSAVTGVGHFIVGTGPVTFVWNGAPGASWTVPTNWTPNRTTPAPTDILQFNAGTHTPTNVPSETIQQLIVGGNVTLASGIPETLTVGNGGVQITGGNALNLGNVILTQAAGGTLQVDGTLNTANSYVNGAGNFVLAAAGTLATTRGDGINGTAVNQGAVQFTGPITYSLGASYTFNSSASAINTRFSAAGGKPAVTANPIGTLTTSGMNVITLDANVTVNTATNVNGVGAFQTGAFTLNQGALATLTIAGNARLRLQTGGGVVNNNASGTSFTVQNMGTLEIQNSGTVTGSSDVNYVAGSILEYSGTAIKTTTAQEIGAAGAQNVVITNTQPVTLGANALIQQNLSINAASRLVISNVGNYTLTLNGTLNQNGGANIASVNGANAGSIALGGAGGIALRLDATDNTLNNFTVNRNGAHTITGDLNVRGTLDLTSGILLPSTRIFSGDPTGITPGTILNGNPNSYVQGRLQRRFTGGIAAAGTNYTFPVGSPAGYRPATLVNTLTGASPVIEAEIADAGAATFDATMSSLLSPRNWRFQTISGVFNGSALTLSESGLTLAYVVGRSLVQSGVYSNVGGNAIVMNSITSNPGAVPSAVNHFFAIGSVLPTITSISPLTVFPGDTISINGTALSGVSSVGIGGFAATSYQIVSPTLIRAVVGMGGSGIVTLISPAGAVSSAQMITFNNAPEITMFSPTFGTTGSSVRIDGNRLSNPISVSFGGLNALSFVSGGANVINAVVNLGNTGPVTVQTPTGVAASAANFDFVRTPSIVNFFPKWARAGDTVNIFGGNFPRVTGVNFGTSAFRQVFTTVTSGQIRILVPPDASTGLVRAQALGVGTDSLGIFTMVRQPTISFVQPQTFVAQGQTLTISGAEFHPMPTVRIGTLTAATVEWTSLNEIRATFTQATSGLLTVIASGGTVSLPSPMQVISPPTITSFSPISPLPGDIVTVTGANFLANLLIVRVNGLFAQNVQRQTDNRLTFTMPQATSGPLLITSLGGSTTTNITFQPLTVTAVQPTSGAIGEQITLTGTRFTGVSAVRFGTVSAAQYTVLSPTQLQVNVPNGATVGTITVVGPAGTATFTGFSITVPSPSISGFNPQMALPGQIVTINGQNFTGTRQVSFGGATTAQFTVVSPSQIRATVPINASSGTITVSNATGTASRAGFVVLAPPVDPNAPLSFFPTFNGAVWAIAVNGTTIYVGGAFTEVTNSPINGGNTVSRSNLAAIDANTGAILPFSPQVNNTVRALIVNGGLGRLYVGGDFTMVNGNTRNLVCSFDVGTNALNAWNPISSYLLHSSTSGAYIRSFALDGNNVYAAGQFTQLNGALRKYGCFFDGTGSGSVDATFFPDMADNQTLGVAVSGGFAFFGGDFTGINGDISKARFGRVNKMTGALDGWNGYGVGAVHTLMVDGNFIYAGGSFAAPHPRNRINRQDVNTSALSPWDPNIGNGDVWAMAASGGNIYVGGDFTLVNGSTTRNALACFDNNGTATGFNPNITGGAVIAVAASGTVVYAGGAFTSVGGQPHQGFAAFNPNAAPNPGTTPANPTTTASTTAPNISAFVPESAAPMQPVTLIGTRFTGVTKVEFGDKQAWFRVVSPTEIQTVVPFGASSGDITVSREMEAGSLTGFSVLEIPRVSTIAGNGRGGLTNVAGQAAELHFPRFGGKIGDEIFFSTVHAIRKVNTRTGEVSTIAGGLNTGTSDAVGTSARFSEPFGILPCDEFGDEGSTHLLVADYNGHKIRIVDIASGEVRTFAGTGDKSYEDGELDEAKFTTPQGLARVPNGNGILITDHEAHTIRGITRFGISTEAGNPGEAGSADNRLPENARFSGPSGIVVDNEYNVYIADRNGHAIRKFSLPTGAVTTLAGTGEAGFADGTSGTAKFNNPMGLALNGNILFVADIFNHRIRAVNTRTGEVVTVAGSGSAGFADGSLQSAQFNAPHSLLWDNGALLVFDTDNHRIRRVEVGQITFSAPVTNATVGMTAATVQAPAPMRITNVEPTTLTEDSPITLFGENISTVASVSLSTGSIESLPLEVISRSTTAIVVQVPNNVVPSALLSTNARLVVTTPTVRISVFQRLQINARDVPWVSIVTPSSGSTRSVVSILGQYFAPLRTSARGSVRSVSIGGLPVQAFAVVSPNVIQVTVGSVRSGKVVVQTLTSVLEASNTFTLDTSAAPVVVVPPPEPVVSKDSIALNRLFAATQGTQWATTANWTNGAPIGTRFGVTVQGGRVVELRLPNSGIRGAIPMEVIENLDALKVLDLSNNRISGVIPPSLANAKNLEVLLLANNQMSGALPRELKTLTNLRNIDLSGNAFSDSLSALSGLTNLAILNLRGNSFRGNLADALPRMVGLTVLDLTGNSISGAIPEELSALTQLQTFRVRGNRLSGSFPMGLVRNISKARAALQVATGLDVLDVGANNLTGPIPDEIRTLQNLRVLLLDSNAFSGELPSSLRSLTRLRRLDIRNNQLSGFVDFSGLPRLDTLLVSNNRFSVAMLEFFVGNRTLQYLPQAPFAQPSIVSRVGSLSSSTAASITVTLQDSLRISVPKTEVFSRTQWRKNGIPITNLPDTNRHADLFFPAFAMADTGVYDCVITNDVLPGITLATAQIQVLGRNPLTAPLAVSLLEPRLGELDVSVIPRFRWTSVASVERYRIEIASDTNFTNVLASAVMPNTASLSVAREILANQQTLPSLFNSGFPLVADRRFAWRVRAENIVGGSPWAVGTFTTLPPDAQITISDWNFGTITRFDTARGEIRLQNLGSATIIIESLQAESADFTLEHQTRTIAPGASLSIPVRFRAQTVGRLSSSVTVRFRVGMSATIEPRTLPNRLLARVSGVRLVAPPFDTVIVGKNRLASAMLINLEDRPITLQRVELQQTTNLSPYSLRFQEQELTIAPRDTVSMLMNCLATTTGTIEGTALRCITYNVPLAQLRREDLDTTFVELRSQARLRTPNDVFVQVGVRVLDDNVAPGSSVRLEIYFNSDKNIDSVFKAAQPLIRGRLRMNNQVLITAPSELGLRRINTISPSADGLQGYILPPTFWQGRSRALAQIRCMAVAGTTSTTALVMEELIWGEGSVNVDSLINSSFTVRVSQAGGKRLIAPTTTELRILSVAPNPAKELVEIAYSLAETGFVELTIINMKGETVQNVRQEVQSAGEHVVQTSLERLPSGGYTIQVRVNGQTESRQVQVVR